MTIPTADRKFRRSPKAPLLPRKRPDDNEFGFDGTSFSGAVFNLSTTIVGAGIMALPATVKQLGLIPGLIMIVLGAVLKQLGLGVEVEVKLQRLRKREEERE